MMEGLDKRESNIRGASGLKLDKARDQAAKLLSDHEAKNGRTSRRKSTRSSLKPDAMLSTPLMTSRPRPKRKRKTTRNRVLGEIDRAKDQAIAELANRERDLIANATESLFWAVR